MMKCLAVLLGGTLSDAFNEDPGLVIGGIIGAIAGIAIGSPVVCWFCSQAGVLPDPVMVAPMVLAPAVPGAIMGAMFGMMIDDLLK